MDGILALRHVRLLRMAPEGFAGCRKNGTRGFFDYVPNSFDEFSLLFSWWGTDLSTFCVVLIDMIWECQHIFALIRTYRKRGNYDRTVGA